MRDKLVSAPLVGGHRVLLLPESVVRYSADEGHILITVMRSAIIKVHGREIDTQLGRLFDNGDLDCKLYLAHLHALSSACLSDPLTNMLGTEAALTLLARDDVRSFTQLSQSQVNRLTAIAKLSPSPEHYPSHVRCMQKLVL
jgi:hypothetical protein